MSEILDRAYYWLDKLKSHKNFVQHVTSVDPLRTDMEGFNLVYDMCAELSATQSLLAEAKASLARFEGAVEVVCVAEKCTDLNTVPYKNYASVNLPKEFINYPVTVWVAKRGKDEQVCSRRVRAICQRITTKTS